MSETLTDLFRYIEASPSPFHAATNACAMAERIEDTEAVRAVVSGGSAIIVLPSAKLDFDQLGFRIICAHTDSPNLRIKPLADIDNTGYQQLAVEPYGGVLLNSWLDRDLGISGRVTLRIPESWQTCDRLVAIDKPLLRIPQLAIHLDREVNQGLKLTGQHLRPVLGQGTGGLREVLAEELGVAAAEIVGWDLMTHDLTAPARLGADGEFYAAPRIDNLASCFCAADAISSLDRFDIPQDSIAVVALFDHEEIGSNTDLGAAGSTFGRFLESYVVEDLGATRQQYLGALGRTFAISADGAHAIHPNYLEKHDSNHHVHLNGGPVIKHNSNKRYATDGYTSTAFQLACEVAGVPFQHYSHHNDLPCGSTIGPIFATQLGVNVVDVGMAQLSMHSAREMGGSEDPQMFRDVLKKFLDWG